MEIVKIAGQNNRKFSSGRKHYYKPSLLLIGTSIMPKLNTRCRAEHLAKNPKELRLEYIQFVRSKRKLKETREEHIIRDMNEHQEKISQVCLKWNTKYEKTNFDSVYTLNKWDKRTKKINYE